MTKKVVISGYYGYSNFGDEAILFTLIQKLKSLKARLIVLSGNPDLTSSTYSVKSIRNFELFDVIRALWECDILVSGGGSLLQDVTSLKSLIYYSFIIAIALFFKKDVIIFAQGIGPINNKLALSWVSFLLAKCRYVSVRDENSLNLLKKFGIKAELLCDPIFALPLEKSFINDAIGVQLREFRSLSDKFLVNLARSIVRTFQNRKIKIFSLQDSLDLDVCNKFAQFIKNIDSKADIEIISGLSGFDLIKKLSSVEFLIGMRYHALLVAMKLGIKSIAINYDIKVMRLAQDFGLPVLNMDENNDFDKIFMAMNDEDSWILERIANSKHFDWSGFEYVIKNNV